jgi:hypothetical protein
MNFLLTSGKPASDRGREGDFAFDPDSGLLYRHSGKQWDDGAPQLHNSLPYVDFVLGPNELATIKDTPVVLVPDPSDATDLVLFVSVQFEWIPGAPANFGNYNHAFKPAIFHSDKDASVSLDTEDSGTLATNITDPDRIVRAPYQAMNGQTGADRLSRGAGLMLAARDHNLTGGTGIIVGRVYYMTDTSMRASLSLTKYFAIDEVYEIDGVLRSFETFGDTSFLTGQFPVINSTANDGIYTVDPALPPVYKGTPCAIIAVNQGTKTFRVAGDKTREFVTREDFSYQVYIVGSTGNDGQYTTVSATFDTDHTDIVVAEDIPDSTADGTAAAEEFTEIPVLEIIPDSTGDGLVVIRS